MCYHQLRKQLIEANIIKLDFKTGQYYVDSDADALVKKLLNMKDRASVLTAETVKTPVSQ